MEKQVNEQIYCKTLNYQCKSIKDAAQLAGVNSFYLKYKLMHSKEVTIGGLVFTTEAPNAQQQLSITKKHLGRKPVGVRCVDSNKEFDSITSLAKYLSIFPANISSQLKQYGEFTDKTGKKYTYIDASKIKPTKTKLSKEELKQMRLANLIKGRKKAKIESYSIKCEQTNTYFKSTAELAKYLNQDESSIANGLKNFGKFIALDGKAYTAIKNTTPKIKTEKKPIGRIGIPIICNETKLKFATVPLASEHYHVHPTTIYASLRKKGQWKAKDGNIYRYEGAPVVSYEFDSRPLKVIQKERQQAILTNTSAAVKQNFEKTELKEVKSEKVICAKLDNEQIALQDTLVSFIKKGMYSEASILCDSLQKIYMKK